MDSTCFQCSPRYMRRNGDGANLKHLPYPRRFDGGRILFWLGHDVSRVTLDPPKICLDSGVHYTLPSSVGHGNEHHKAVRLAIRLFRTSLR